ncbi:MAG: lipopolysaccharide heptosyltransferase family protein, partial [Acidobacteria bacterium]
MKLPHPRRILVIRTDKIGDMVLSTAALRAIRVAHPGARLVVLASPYNAPVIEGCPLVDAIELLDHCWPVARRMAVARALRRENFDLCLVFNPNQEAYLLAWLSGAPMRIGIVHERRLFDLAVAGALLSHPVLSHVEGAAVRGGRVPHEVELTRRALERAGIPWAGDELEAPTTDETRMAADGMLRRTWPGSAPPVGFHLSMKWLGQGWTVEHVGRLLSAMLDDCPDRRLLVTWVPCDAPAAAALLALPGLGFRPAAGCADGLNAAVGS